MQILNSSYIYILIHRKHIEYHTINEHAHYPYMQGNNDVLVT